MLPARSWILAKAISVYEISSWTDNSYFLDQICPKNIFPIKSTKSKRHQWTLLIEISLGTKFQFKLTFLVFWTKFAQKEYFWSKNKKVNGNIELCIF